MCQFGDPPDTDARMLSEVRSRLHELGFTPVDATSNIGGKDYLKGLSLKLRYHQIW